MVQTRQRTREFLIALTIFGFLAVSSKVYAQQEIRPLVSRLSDGISKAGKKRVGVVDFVDLQGNVTELGRFLAEETSVALLEEAKGFNVIDRSHLKAILQENQMAAAGLTDTQSVMKLGQIAGLDALVTGTITPFGETVRLSVKVMDASTALIVAAASADIPKTKGIGDLLATTFPATEVSRAAPAASPRTATPTSSNSGVPPLSASIPLGRFSNTFLKAEVTAVDVQTGLVDKKNSRSPFGDPYYTVAVELIMENILNEDLYLLGEEDASGRFATLSDSRANQCRQVETQGLSSLFSMLAVRATQMTKYTAVSAGSSSHVLMRFNCAGEAAGSQFRLNLALLRLTKNGPNKFSIGFTQLVPQAR